MSAVTGKRKRKDTNSIGEQIFAELNQEDIVENYVETRHIDEVSCQNLFAQEFENSVHPITVLDVGCGVGRLAIPIVQKFRHVTIIGIDTSESMIAHANKRRNEKQISDDRLKFVNTSLFSFPDDPLYSNLRFDYVLCHWCFHCIRPWRSALLACINLTKPNTGRLLWLQEESSIYLALDNLDYSVGKYQVDRPTQWKAFWTIYHDKRDRIESYARANHRLGTVLRCTDDLDKFLKPLGWIVREEGRVESWNKSESYEDLINKYLRPRAFTNLQRLPSEKNDQLIREVVSDATADKTFDLQDRVNLKYDAKLISAYPDRTLADKTQSKYLEAAENILACSREIYYDALDLCDFAERRPGALSVLRQILKVFFASLFVPNSIPLWQHFWQPDDAHNTCPRWVWIRLPKKPAANFRRFLEDHLWVHTNVEGLFQKSILEAYFRSGATLAHLAQSTRREFWRPISVHINSGSAIFEVRSSATPDFVELIVPSKFVEAYCAEPYEAPGKFERDQWEADSLSYLTTLFHQGAGEGEQDWQDKLREFGRDIDQAFGVSMYEQNPRRFVELLQSIRLFPGTYYYFFPVRRASGEIVSSISFATDHPLSSWQITMLIGTVDRLLTVPSLVIRLITRRRMKGENQLVKTVSSLSDAK